MDLLAQHVGHPASTVGPGSANGYRLSHAATLTQLRGIFRVANQQPRWQVEVLRRMNFSGDQRKPGPGWLLRHLRKSAAFAIPVIRTVRVQQPF
ncbi:hypothetical protein ATCCBAA256_27630 [Mycobacterium montefiorense]|nr:hypothetical protein ATCCBAA256_27630 [Mycobacterium montefiorense]